eukprot:CAMPEP_0201592076 /NCGR_PEP_ID=MMETSP0190_2-20130828/190063_1 /ASSEMBLY_ACC=CAM_ASM_000263 /TAXON_ID=37353 /ORGANISM="Rosalina sp." /LENGTH=611 /DNA_ID=CAMNT_0048050677 /DNA_START=578 /DNA_END=2410 /DNA_ORIENTATION=-
MTPMLIGLVTLLSAIMIKAQHIDWFKRTSYHKQNRQKLEKGWEECPDWNILSIKQQVSFEGVEQIQLPKHNNTIYNITALCITLQVPLDWDNDNPNDLETVDYFITRAFSGFNENNTNNNGALWMLQGGPGGSGEGLYPYVIPTMNFMENKFDIYVPDQRGTGYSNYLSEEDFNDTEYIKHFTAYSHAMDLGYAIDLFQNEFSYTYNHDNDIVYGVSYGTYYLNQYLILFPDQVNAAIFDGVVDPQKTRWSTWDRDANEVGLLFFQRCQNDVFCKEKFDELNTTILDATKHIIDQLEGNAAASKCVQESSDRSSSGFKALLYEKLASSHYRVEIPWIIHRLYQCDERDIQWAEEMKSKYKSQTTTATAGIDGLIFFFGVDATDANDVLSNYMIFSELWEFNSSYPGPSFIELIGNEEQYLISLGMDAAMKQQHDEWKAKDYLYEPNPLVYNEYADPQIPILILNGDLDPQTQHKYALNLAKEYGANIDNVETANDKQRYFITMPNAPHYVLFNSDIRNFTDNTIEWNHDFETCGLYILKSFLDPDNNYIPNIDCINWLTGIDFEGVSYHARHSVDLWGIVTEDNNSSIETTSYDDSDDHDVDEWEDFWTMW